MTRTPARCPLIAAALALAIGAGAVQAADCAALTGEAPDDTSITEAADINPASGKPGFCRITGTIDATIGFELHLPLPKAWNGKFNGVGNGGLAGFINTEALDAAVARGYAAASTDTGHVGHPVPGAPPFPGFDASWALGPDGQPDTVALENFGHRGTHRMTEVAKRLVAAYYGAPPAYSYFTGCSGGGQQGLAEAQRYPEDYDGIVVGAPANHPMAMWPGEIYPAVLARILDIAALTAKLPLIQDASVKQCDATDGVEDGLIADPRACQFHASSLICKKDADPATCLTEDEAKVIDLTYIGLRNPTTGALVWPGFEPGSESQWGGHLRPFAIQLGYLAYMVFRDPAWQFDSFDITRPADFARVQDANKVLAPMLEATDANLAPFAKHGGRLLMWHGWADQNIAPRNSIAYAEAVRAALGAEKAREVMRLFMLPGLNHCQGGPGFTDFDALAALEGWVERDDAPDRLMAKSPALGATRAICASPARTVYKSGDPRDPASYACE